MRSLAAIALVTVCAPVWGQSAEIWFNGGTSLTTSGLGGATVNDYHLTDGFRLGFGFCLNPQRIFGYEVQYNYNRTHLHSDSSGGDLGGMAIHQGDFNMLVYGTKEGARFRPFVTGGIGFANYVPPGSSATSGGGANEFSFNYGGGMKFRLTSLLSTRFDIRQYATPTPFGLPLASGWVHQTAITGGVGIVF